MRTVFLSICLIIGVLSTSAIANSSGNLNSVFDLSVKGMPEPLIRAWPTSISEDQDLSEAVKKFQERSIPDEMSSLENFIIKHKETGWAPAVLLNIGLAYRHFGYVTRAEEALRSAWDQGRATENPAAKALIDKAVGELALLYASLGQSYKLANLFEEIKSRAITGSATEKIQIARETLDLVEKDPRHLFNCGPLALRSLLIGVGAASKHADALRWYKASANGTNLAEVAGLAAQAGFSHHLIKRELGQQVPVPSIIHFKSGHFATLLAVDNGRYHIFDPVFGGQDLWLTAGAVDAEASGYFLVPEALMRSQIASWKDVTLVEAGKVWGKGPTNGVVPGDAGDPLANGPANPDPGPPQCGMCRYDIKEATVGLTLWDIPVGYAPAIGPKVQTRISYNQREDSQPAVFGFYNVSPKWTLNWLTYVVDDPQNPGGNVSRSLPGGGAYFYVGYSNNTGSFLSQTDDGSILSRSLSGSISYKRQLRDGTTEYYSQADGSNNYPRRIFISKIVDPQGNTLTFSYDAQQRLTMLTDAVGQKTKFGYTQVSRPLLVTQITDPFGRSAKISYDLFGRLTSITDVIGLTSQFSYDANGLVNAMTTPYGTTSFSYTAPGSSSPPRFLDITDPLGFHEREEWLEPAPIPDSDPAASVPQGMPVAPTNQYLTYRNSFHWDKAAYAVAGCAPSGGCDYTKARVRHFVHASVGIKGIAIESEKYPLESRVWYNYPGQGASNFSGSFNSPSAVARVLDDGTTQISYSYYDTQGFNLTKAVDPVGRTTLFTYAPNGTDLLAVTQSTEDGNFSTIAQFTYKNQRRPITFTDASGSVSTYDYNHAGQLISTKNALQEINRFTYDTYGNLLTVVNSNGVNATAFAYDAFNRIRTYTDSEGWTITYEYDAADRITSITYPDGTTQVYTYDRLDLVKYRDRQFRVWTYVYDANRQLVKTTDPAGGNIRLAYDPNGKLNSLTDAKGNNTSWKYDIQGRLINKKYADSSMYSYTYESTTSRLKSVSDALSQIKQYSYYRDNRLSGVNYLNSINPTSNVAFTDDPYFPRTISMTDGTGTTTYTYALGFAPGAFRLARECLNPTGSNTSCASTIAYDYDALGRMSSRTVSGSGPETVAYDALGRVAIHTSDLGSFALSYLGQTDQPTLRQLLPSTQNFQTAWSYLPNSSDRRLSAITNTGLSVGQYTNFQLISTPERFLSGIAQQSDTSLALPLATSQTASFNTLNQLIGLSGQSLSYDANGNLLSDGTRAYTWDAENRLVRIIYPDNPGKESIFTYDGRGRRVTISDTPTGGGTPVLRSYIWCGISICQSRNDSGSSLRYYTAEGEFQSGSLPQFTYYGTDQIGSIRRAFNSDGSAPSFEYDPYGNNLQSIPSTTDFGYAGMQYHHESGLNLTLYRVYDPNIGRWISRDPIGEASGIVSNQLNMPPMSYIRPEINLGATIGFAFDNKNQGFYGSIGDQLSVSLSVGSDIYARNLRQIARVSSLRDNTNLYEYVSSNPLTQIDPLGLWKVTWGHGGRHVGDPAAAEAEILGCLPAQDDVWGDFHGITPSGMQYRAHVRGPGWLHIGTYFYPN